MPVTEAMRLLADILIASGSVLETFSLNCRNFAIFPFTELMGNLTIAVVVVS